MDPITYNPSILYSSNKNSKLNDYSDNINKFERDTIKNLSSDKM